MITLNDKKKKFLEINSGNLSPDGKLKEIEAYLAEADKLNEKEQKDLEKQKEDEAKKAEKALADEQKAKDKEASDAKKAEAQEKSDSSIKKVEVVGAELITIKGEKGDPGADSDVPGPMGPEGKAPTEIQLLSLIKPLIPKSVKEDDSIKSELKKIITPLIPKPMDGKDGENGNKIFLVEREQDLPKNGIIGDICVVNDTKEVFIYE